MRARPTGPADRPKQLVRSGLPGAGTPNGAASTLFGRSVDDVPRTPLVGAADRAAGGQRRVAFTLIELLVVIAIISLLISILLPSLQRARQHADAVVCRSNQHAIGIAHHLYASECEGWMPLVLWSSTQGMLFSAPQAFQELKYLQATLPAGISNPNSGAGYGCWDCVSKKTPGVQYAYNVGSSRDRQSAALRPYRVSDFPVTPGSLDYWTVGQYRTLWACHKHCDSNYSWNWYEKYSAMDGPDAFPHMGSSANFLYFDAHVRTVRRNPPAPPSGGEPRDYLLSDEFCAEVEGG